MHTHKFLRTLPRSLLSAALVAGITTAAGVFAVDGNPPGLFELDGNTVDTVAPGDDWDSIFLGNNTGTPVASTGILADPAPLTIFTQGGSKDINDVSAWRHTNGNVPDKDDITNAYATGYINPSNVSHNGQVVHEAGDLIIYFGLDRYANNGDAFAGFWFFQQDVGLGPNGTFQGVHTARNGSQRGDLLVLVEYPQGANAQPQIKVYEWDPLDADNDNVATNLDEIYSSSNAKCDGSGNKLACAITNVNNLTNTPAWPYTPKSGPASDLPKESFFEGGINVTRLLGGATPCFSSFLAETRSSRSETAQLKDFVLGNFDLCAISVTKSCEAEVSTTDGGNSIVVNFGGSVTNSGGLALENVTVVDDMGTPGNTADDVVVFGPATLQPGETQPYTGSYTTTAIPATDRVTATGSRGTATVSATADASCSPTVTPGIAIEKACNATLRADGSGIDVLFEGIVTNTGNVALANVTVVDDNGTADPSDDVTVLGPVTLNAGASMPYSGGFGVTGSNTSTDHVVATGTDVLTDVDVSANAEATCLADTNPLLEVTKQCTAAVNDAGTGVVVSFNGSVTNMGNVILNNVTVVDDNGTPGNTNDDVTLISNATLAVGESLPFEGTFNTTGTASTDVVTATANDYLTGAAISDTETATCIADVNPAIEVTKQCVDATAFDQPISFSGTVTNTGDVALLGVIVVDDNGTPANPLDDQTFIIGDLAPGATANYSGSYSPGTGTWTNSVVASGTDAIQSGTYTANDSATCEVPPPPEFEGCTPGFWKNSTGSWVGYSPNQLLTAAGFVLPSGAIANQLGGDTLMTALGYPGGNNLVGGAQILLRAAVASLLNASHPDVSFPLTTAEIISQVNTALATKDRGTILALASQLDTYNNLGCDLPNDNSF